MDDVQKNFFDACINGDLGAVKSLLQGDGVDIDARDKDGFPPLMIAIGNLHAEVAKFLIEKGANVNLSTENGATAFSTATYLAGHGDGDKFAEIIILLLNANADMEVNNQGYAALCVASKKGYINVVESLIQKGLNLRDEWGDKALFVATESGQAKIANLLTSKGAILKNI